MRDEGVEDEDEEGVHKDALVRHVKDEVVAVVAGALEQEQHA